MKPKSMTLGSSASRAVFRSATTIAAAANCRLSTYRKVKVPSFTVTEDLIAYASPDSTYAVTKRLFDAATKSILIGIYDFTASYIKDLLIKAMQRGVKVELMLDLDGKDEKRVFDELIDLGVDGLRAPSCAHPTSKHFSVVHQKVVIIDGRWTMVQSGNFSNNSIPRNETDGGDTAFVPGNRDMGIAIKSAKVAAFFKKQLASDRQLARGAGPAALAMLRTLDAGVISPTFMAAPKLPPAKLFPSKTFHRPAGVKIQPVYTPDNYLLDVPPFLASARKSIRIEQQYIRAWQPQVKQVLAGIGQAMQAAPGLRVEIVIGKAFSQDGVKKFKDAEKLLKDTLGLKLMKNIRYINQDRFVHCHNKLAIVDDKAVLISSQNLSDTAVNTNREAGVIVHDADVAKYYAAIFDSDWDTGVDSPVKTPTRLMASSAFATGKVVKLDLGDIIEV